MSKKVAIDQASFHFALNYMGERAVGATNSEDDE